MKKVIKKLRRLVGPSIIVAAAIVSPSVALAQSLVPAELLAISDIVAVVRGIIRFILLFAFVAAFILLLVGGVRWILANGDEKAVISARNTITAAIIGLVIVLISYAIIKVVETFFKVSIISSVPVIPTI